MFKPLPQRGLNLLRSCVVSCAALAAFGMASPAAAQANEAYPNRPIKIVVAFPPGGSADLSARLIGQKMSESMRQPVVIENRPGANGSLGADAVARSAPDGYTLVMLDRGALGINPSLYAKLPYHPVKDFAPIGIVTEGSYVLVANPTLAVNSVGELITLARAKPRSIAYGSYGIGSMAHLNLEAFNLRHGTDLQHVPYTGAGPAVQAVVGGEVGVTIASVPVVLGFIRDGRLRALAVGADKRLAQLPDTPTLAEGGGSTDTLLATFFALAAPTGTPAAIVTRLNDEMKQALASPEVADKLGSNGLVPVASSPSAMADVVARDIASFAVRVRAIGIKAE